MKNKIRNIVKYSTQYHRVSNYRIISQYFTIKKYPLIKKHQKIRPFFIIGCGRSGNTLLRAILCSNSKVSIPPESYVLGKVYNKFRMFNILAWPELVKIIVAEFESHENFSDWKINLQPVYQKLIHIEENDQSLAKIIDVIFRHYSDEKFPGYAIWGDKTPQNNLWIDKIHKIFPEAKYINIIRDGRDVSCSFLRSGHYTDIDTICRYWNMNILLTEKFEKKTKRLLKIRYEDLVSKPEKEIRIICKFLNIRFEKKMIKPNLLFNKLGDVPVHKHHHNIIKPINTNSIGKWRKNFSKKQQKIVNKILQKNLKKLDYENDQPE